MEVCKHGKKIHKVRRLDRTGEDPPWARRDVCRDNPWPYPSQAELSGKQPFFDTDLISPPVFTRRIQSGRRSWQPQSEWIIGYSPGRKVTIAWSGILFTRCAFGLVPIVQLHTKPSISNINTPFQQETQILSDQSATSGLVQKRESLSATHSESQDWFLPYTSCISCKQAYALIIFHCACPWAEQQTYSKSSPILDTSALRMFGFCVT